MLENTRKPPIMCIFSGADTSQQLHDLACARCGGAEAFKRSPNYGVYGQFVSPFQHEIMATDRLVFCADNFVPIIYVPTIMMGASGPVTLAGAIAVANAECLAGLVMHQLRSPGAPFIYGACVSPLDMRTTVFSYGAPEWRVADAVLSQLSQRYNLPIFGTAGATDAGAIDAQSGAEWAYSLLLCALAGTNLIHDVGYMASGMTGSLEALVVCDEIIGMVKSTVNGFDISDDTLVLDLVNKVGPGGHFMGEDHTLEHFRNAIWYPTVFDRNRHEEGQARVEPTLIDRAAVRVSQLLGG
jgi:trimethylamine---corrinoid protein Co-methyltransferase